jgi:N-acetylglucosamine-6-sulfatase
LQEIGYVTDLLTDRAIAFMRASRGQPFLVFLAHKALHPNIVQHDDGSSSAVPGQSEGFIPAPRHAGRYADAPVPRRPNAGRRPAGKPALLRPIEGVTPLGPDTATPDRDVRARLEMLLAVDESLGRIVSELEAAGSLDRTLVVVMSDHGYFYGEHDLNEERRLAYEESARIPLILRYPAVAAAGATPAELVQTIDLAPTVLELAGVADRTQRDGRSLLPLLRGSEGRGTSLLPLHTRGHDKGVELWGLRAPGAKLIVDQRTGRREFYLLDEDPGETRNLHPDPRAATLARGLDALVLETGAARPRLAPEEVEALNALGYR